MGGLSQGEQPKGIKDTVRGTEVQPGVDSKERVERPEPEEASNTTTKEGVDYANSEHGKMVEFFAKNAIQSGDVTALEHIFSEMVKMGERGDSQTVIKDTLLLLSSEFGPNMNLARATLDSFKEKELVHDKRSTEIVNKVIADMQEGNTEWAKTTFTQLETMGERDLALQVIEGLKRTAVQPTEMGKLALGTLDQIALVTESPELQQKIAMAAAESAHAPEAEDLLSNQAAFEMASNILERQLNEDGEKLAQDQAAEDKMVESGIFPEDWNYARLAAVKSDYKERHKEKTPATQTEYSSEEKAKAAERAKLAEDPDALANFLASVPPNSKQDKNEA